MQPSGKTRGGDEPCLSSYGCQAEEMSRRTDVNRVQHTRYPIPVLYVYVTSVSRAMSVGGAEGSALHPEQQTYECGVLSPSLHTEHITVAIEILQ